MKAAAFFVGGAIITFLSSCMIKPHPMDMSTAVENAITRADHEGLAAHYEEAAKDMEAKAANHESRLAEYRRYRGLNSREAQWLIDHCQRLVRLYNEAAVENLRMAESHRQLAREA